MRNRVAWTKPNPLPSSAADRLTQSWEFVYLLVRQRHYFFDLDAIREPARANDATTTGAGSPRQQSARDHGHSGLNDESCGVSPHWARIPVTGGESAERSRGLEKLPRRVIRRPIRPAAPRRSASVAANPGSEPSIRCGSRPASLKPRSLVPCDCGAATRPGVVLDPFMGSGTVALIARSMGRDWLGIELNPEYVRLTESELERIHERRRWMAHGRRKGEASRLSAAAKVIHSKGGTKVTKAQEVFEKVNALIEGGADRPEAFKQVATEYGQPINTIRGSYYSYSRGATGNGRPRRRETTRGHTRRCSRLP